MCRFSKSSRADGWLNLRKTIDGTSASASITALAASSASATINSLRLIEPSSNLGIVACSGMLSARLSIAAPDLSLESVMSAIPDSKAGTASL